MKILAPPLCEASFGDKATFPIVYVEINTMIFYKSILPENQNPDGNHRQLKIMSGTNTLDERQMAVLAYARIQIAACCFFFAIAEIAIAHDELGSIFRLVYISPSLSLAASIFTIAYYVNRSWFYKIATGFNGLGLICCVAALVWVVFSWITHTGQVLKSSAFSSYCALMIILLLQFAPSLLFEISLKLASRDHNDKESHEKVKDSGSQT